MSEELCCGHSSRTWRSGAIPTTSNGNGRGMDRSTRVEKYNDWAVSARCNTGDRVGRTGVTGCALQAARRQRNSTLAWDGASGACIGTGSQGRLIAEPRTNW